MIRRRGLVFYFLELYIWGVEGKGFRIYERFEVKYELRWLNKTDYV